MYVQERKEGEKRRRREEERREKKRRNGRWARYNLFFKVGGKEVGSKKRKEKI